MRGGRDERGGGCLCCWSRKSCPGHRLASDKTIRFSHNLGKIIPTPNTYLPWIQDKQALLVNKPKEKEKKEKKGKRRKKKWKKKLKKKRQKEKKEMHTV